MTRSFHLPEHGLHPVLGAVRSNLLPPRPVGVSSHPKACPFIAISRQAGAGATTLAKSLVDRLNSAGAIPTWEAYDRELCEKISQEHRLSQSLVESLEERNRYWLEEFFAGLPSNAPQEPSDHALFQSVTTTVRALAQRGHVVLVGCGSPFITRDMPGAITIRLVAPLQYRIANAANLWQTSTADAARRIKAIDAARANFYKRWWPHSALAPEEFMLTLNTALLDESQLTQTVAALLTPHSVPVPA